MSEKNDNRGNLYNQIAKGVNLAAKGNAELRKGFAIAATGMVHLVTNAMGDKETMETLVRHMAGINVDARKQPTAFEASWDYWKDIFQDVQNKNRPSFNRVTKKDIEDYSERGETNSAANASIKTLRDAAAVGYFVATAKELDPEGFVFWETKADMFGLSYVNALKLIGDEAKPSPMGEVVQTHARFSFNVLKNKGREAMTKAGVIEKRLATDNNKAAPVPLRDMVHRVREAMLSADTKAFDATTALEVYGLLVACIDRLNEREVPQNYRLTSTEEAKVIHAFASTMINKLSPPDAQARVAAELKAKAA